MSIIRQVSEGLGGSWTFFVRGTKRRLERMSEDNVKLVKIGKRFDMRNEKSNFDLILDGYVDTFLGIIRDEHAESGNLAGIVYAAVGSSQDYLPGEDRFPRGLRTAFKTNLQSGIEDSWKQIRDHVNGAFEHILKGFYRNKIKKERYAILKCYGLLLPPVVTATFSGKLEEVDPVVTLDRPETLSNVEKGKIIKFRGRVFETEQVDHSKAKGLVRLYDAKTQIKIDIRYPDDPHLAHAFEKLASDPRLRRGKRLELTARVLFDRSDFLWNRISQIESASTGRAYLKRFANKTDVADFVTKLRLPEPIEFLTKIDFGTEIDATISTIHGDLNLDNILVSGEKHYSYWLVDFAKTEPEGHTAYDLAKLEVEMRTQILSDLLFDYIIREEGHSKNPTQVFEGILARFTEWEQDLFYPPSGEIEHEISAFVSSMDAPSPVKNLYGGILAVRSRASGALGIGYLEYLYALFFYSLSALKFRNLIDSTYSRSAPLPRVLAYLTAAVACKKIQISTETT